MSRFDQAILNLQQERPVLLVDDFCPKFVGYIISSCVENSTKASEIIESISNNLVEVLSQAQGGTISYCGPNQAASELQALLKIKYMLISPCNNEVKERASEKELRALSAKYNIPPLFLTDVAKFFFQKNIKLSETLIENLADIKFIQYSNPYSNSVHSVFIKGQVNQEESHDFEPINLIILQKPIHAENNGDCLTLLQSYSRAILLHICQPNLDISELNKIFFVPAKILTKLGVRRINIITKTKPIVQGIAAFGIEVIRVIT